MAPNDKAVAPMAAATYDGKKMRNTHGVRDPSCPYKSGFSGTDNDIGAWNAATIRANFENV